MKSFGGEDAEREKFRAAQRGVPRHEEPLLQVYGRLSWLNSLFTGLLYTIVVVGGGYFVAAPEPLAL